MPGQNSVIVASSTFKFKFVNLYVLKYIHIYYENVTDSLKTVESGMLIDSGQAPVRGRDWHVLIGLFPAISLSKTTDFITR